MGKSCTCTPAASALTNNNYLALFSHCLVYTTGKVSPINSNVSAEPEDLDVAGTSTFKESSFASCSVQQSQLKADITPMSAMQKQDHQSFSKNQRHLVLVSKSETRAASVQLVDCQIQASSCVVRNRTNYVAKPVTETSMHLRNCRLEIYSLKIGLNLEALNVAQIHSFKMTLNIYDPTYVPEIKRAIDSLKKILDTCDSTNIVAISVSAETSKIPTHNLELEELEEPESDILRFKRLLTNDTKYVTGSPHTEGTILSLPTITSSESPCSSGCSEPGKVPAVGKVATPAAMEMSANYNDFPEIEGLKKDTMNLKRLLATGSSHAEGSSHVDGSAYTSEVPTIINKSVAPIIETSRDSKMPPCELEALKREIQHFRNTLNTHDPNNVPVYDELKRAMESLKKTLNTIHAEGIYRPWKAMNKGTPGIHSPMYPPYRAMPGYPPYNRSRQPQRQPSLPANHYGYSAQPRQPCGPRQPHPPVNDHGCTSQPHIQSKETGFSSRDAQAPPPPSSSNDRRFTSTQPFLSSYAGNDYENRQPLYPVNGRGHNSRQPLTGTAKSAEPSLADNHGAIMNAGFHKEVKPPSPRAVTEHPHDCGLQQSCAGPAPSAIKYDRPHPAENTYGQPQESRVTAETVKATPSNTSLKPKSITRKAFMETILEDELKTQREGEFLPNRSKTSSLHMQQPVLNADKNNTKDKSRSEVTPKMKEEELPLVTGSPNFHRNPYIAAPQRPNMHNGPTFPGENVEQPLTKGQALLKVARSLAKYNGYSPVNAAENETNTPAKPISAKQKESTWESPHKTSLLEASAIPINTSISTFKFKSSTFVEMRVKEDTRKTQVERELPPNRSKTSSLHMEQPVLNADKNNTERLEVTHETKGGELPLEKVTSSPASPSRGVTGQPMHRAMHNVSVVRNRHENKRRADVKMSDRNKEYENAATAERTVPGRRSLLCLLLLFWPPCYFFLLAILCLLLYPLNLLKSCISNFRQRKNKNKNKKTSFIINL